MILREAGARAERLLEDRNDQALRELDERRPRLRVVGAGSDDERRRRATEDRNSASASTAAGSTAAARSTRPAAASSRASSAGASQSSIGTITSAGPRWVAASWYARSIAPGTSCGRTGCSTETGYSPASPSSRPARNGSKTRCRRSCWPTRTTSGARFTRAVASAPTALPSPAVVCTTASAGSPRPIANPVAIATTDPLVQREHERQVVRQPARNGTSVEPGFANSVVSPRRRKTSNAASRTVRLSPRLPVPLRRSSAVSPTAPPR